MTRRTFLLLVCRFVGLLSAKELLLGAFGLPNLERLLHPGYLLVNKDIPWWAFLAVAFPTLVCSSGIGVGVFATRIAARIPAGGEVTSRRFGLAIATTMVAWTAISTSFSVANSDGVFFYMLTPHLDNRTIWPLFEIPCLACALVWLCKRGLASDAGRFA